MLLHHLELLLLLVKSEVKVRVRLLEEAHLMLRLHKHGIEASGTIENVCSYTCWYSIHSGILGIESTSSTWRVHLNHGTAVIVQLL